jgi:mevalonate pyrophosphate decarboxylase
MTTLIVLFVLSFIAGFLTMWFWTNDLGSNVVIFASEEELQQLCWDGLRDGEKNR